LTQLSSISTTTNISNILNKSTPDIPKLKLSDTSLKDPAIPANSNNCDNLKKNYQSNTEMLVNMRKKLIKNLTSRDEDQHKSEIKHNDYANLQTERAKGKKIIKPAFMNPTQSKKQYIIDKVDDLTSVTKQLQKINKKPKQTENIVQRNKIVKLEKKTNKVQLSAKDELKYLKKSTVNFLVKFFKQEFKRQITAIHFKRDKIEQNKEL